MIHGVGDSATANNTRTEKTTMKLLRYGKAGAEKPGMLDADGKIRDLSGVIADISAATLSPASLRKLAKIDPASLPAVRGKPRLGACVARPLNFVCIGLNYADHAAETGAPIPKEPIVFLKSLGAYAGPNDDVKMPKGSKKLDYEVELGIVIGTTARYVSEADALNHVAGYCVINDVSEREFQSERGGTWDKGKGCDTFGPTGPWMVTKDEIPDPQNLAMWLEVDGKRKQNGNTRTMIFGVRQIVSYVSHFITLHAGDVIATGTPPGVGLGQKPRPIFLKLGQTMTLGIDGLGQQSQKVVAA
jgi:2-keto-4-pentenoate hydratase/2-oxohepta-3-ene-1,7-dioic acid hydratase in catechol pathway